MKLADRTRLIDASGIRKIFDMAATLQDPVNLSIGQPDFDIPDIIKSAAKDAIDKGFNQYTPTQGSGDLLAALRDHITTKKGTAPDDLMVTSGASGGILLSFLALLDPGDEIIIPDPYFVMYKHLANLAGAKPVILDTYPDFRINEAKLNSLITPRTRIIIINSPNNPTGRVMTEQEIDIIINAAQKNNITIIADEVYDSFIYSPELQSLPGPFGKYKNTIVLNGFSKTYSMTGWRIGYAYGPQPIISEMKKLQQYTFVCAPSFAQKSLVDNLSYDMSAQREAYARKRDLIYSGLSDVFEINKPEGSFYTFPKAPEISATEFVAKAIKKSLLIIPGNVFSEKDSHFRISFAQKDEIIKKGIEILRQLRKDYE